jgi:ubiquitin C-terminal hydrolase
VKNEQDIKIDKLLDMSKYFYFDTETESTYSLKSVALHHGNPYNGHYTTMLFDNDDEKTFIDDMDIVKMNDKDFNINNDAYLLLYERNS